MGTAGVGVSTSWYQAGVIESGGVLDEPSKQALCRTPPSPATKPARHLLRHLPVPTRITPEKITIRNDPTRGALALFEGGRKSPHEAAERRKSFCGLVF